LASASTEQEVYSKAVVLEALLCCSKESNQVPFSELSTLSAKVENE
jgi:hypothetical protein